MSTAIKLIRARVDAEQLFCTLPPVVEGPPLARLRLGAGSASRGARPVPTPAEQLLRALAAYMTASPGSVSTAHAGGDGEIHVSFRVTLGGDAPELSPSEAVARAQESLGLTAREAEVLLLVGRYLTNREIADELVISVRTAEHHVAHILRKLGAPDRRAAAAIAQRLASPQAAVQAWAA